MPYFDPSIGMWEAEESPEEALEREYEAYEQHQRAAAVAQQVSDEVAALQWEAAGGHVSHDWRGMGAAILASLRTTPWGQARLWACRQRFYRGWPLPAPVMWFDPESDPLIGAPWGVLLDPSLPLGVDWAPTEMLRLRGVCTAFRGGLSTAQFFSRVLEALGIPKLREHCHSPRRLFEFASRVFAELAFVHSCRTVAACAAGLLKADTSANDLCCVAGSYALHRALMLGCNDVVGSAQGPTTPSWAPGDMDIFVGTLDSSRRSKAAFDAVVEHARTAFACFSRHADDIKLWGSRGLPLVTYSSTYEHAHGLGEIVPASVAVAMGAFQGFSYSRDDVLDYSHAWDQPLVDAIKRQPETLGVHRPYQVDRVAEVEHPARLHHFPVAFDSLWPLPRKINIIQYSSGEAPGGAPRPPLTPLALVRGFDVLPAMVVMRVDHSLKPRFLATDDVARCVRRRELRLSPFAFGPAVADDRRAMEAAVRRQLVRLDKYRHAYGFALPEDAAQGA